MAAHTQTGNEGFIGNKIVFLFHLRVKFAPEEGSPLHFIRIRVVEVPAVVETVGSNDSEICSVGNLLNIVFLAPVGIATAPSVKKEQGRGVLINVYRGKYQY